MNCEKLSKQSNRGFFTINNSSKEDIQKMIPDKI
jgi:hypothetical protein